VSRSPRVAVLGAGVAGLSAAVHLRDAGIRVEVFDKGRGPGGRICSRRSAGHEFDHGAQYFTARDPLFVDQVEIWRQRDVVAPWTGRIVSVERGCAPQPAGPSTRYVGVPGMNAPAADLAAGLRVHSHVRITSIERSWGSRWQLFHDREVLPGDFDRVLLTLPPEQALPLVAGHPRLSPRLHAVRMLPCWAVLVAFVERVDAAFDGAFVNSGPLSWVARNSSKPGRPRGEAWVLHATPQWSREFLDRDSGFVESALFEAFRHVLGTSRIPPSTWSAAHRWRFALPEEPLEARCLFDEADGIGLAGDWCGGPRVEGAWLSGRALAERVLAA
jgi:renalase